MLIPRHFRVVLPLYAVVLLASYSTGQSTFVADFDDLAPGTQVSTEYLDRGMGFSSSGSPGEGTVIEDPTGERRLNIAKDGHSIAIWPVDPETHLPRSASYVRFELKQVERHRVVILGDGGQELMHVNIHESGVFEFEAGAPIIEVVQIHAYWGLCCSGTVDAVVLRFGPPDACSMEPPWTVERIEPNGEPLLSVRDIEGGWATGQHVPDGEAHAFRHRLGTQEIDDLANIPGGWSSGWAINRHGHVAGDFQNWAFLWTPEGSAAWEPGFHALLDPTDLCAGSSRAFDVNAETVVAGMWRRALGGSGPSEQPSVWYRRGSLSAGYARTKRLALATGPGQALALNDEDLPLVVGEVSQRAMAWRLVRDSYMSPFEVDQAYALNSLVANGTSPAAKNAPAARKMARGVTDGGQIVGDARDLSGKSRAVRWVLSAQEPDEYRVRTLPRFGEPMALPSQQGQAWIRPVEDVEGAALAINEDGVIVGWYWDPPGESHAFVYDEVRGLRNIEELVDPASGWYLDAATAVDEQGRVLCSARRGVESSFVIAYPDCP